MLRHQLEHVIRAAGAIVEADRIVVVGSQAVLGSFPDAPRELTASMEADIFPLDKPELAEIIDGTIGEMSPFHEQFGYYAHGVGPETAVVPVGWQERLRSIKNENTRGIEGLCLCPEDLAISKLAAGREKDLAFVKILVAHKIASLQLMRDLSENLREPFRQAVVDNIGSL